MSLPYADDNLIWIDLEMTGLDTQNDYIIEIATVVTDSQLNLAAEGPVLAVHQSEQVLLNMDDWNTRQHTQSGLLARVQSSRLDRASGGITNPGVFTALCRPEHVSNVRQ